MYLRKIPTVPTIRVLHRINSLPTPLGRIQKYCKILIIISKLPVGKRLFFVNMKSSACEEVTKLGEIFDESGLLREVDEVGSLMEI